uniref:Putative secreted protein n=1 Tax=Ixodes ricinus TaxID=34613 RepID=A0A6B0UDW4_IXORI
MQLPWAGSLISWLWLRLRPREIFMSRDRLHGDMEVPGVPALWRRNTCLPLLKCKPAVNWTRIESFCGEFLRVKSNFCARSDTDCSAIGQAR